MSNLFVTAEAKFVAAAEAKFVALLSVPRCHPAARYEGHILCPVGAECR